MNYIWRATTTCSCLHASTVENIKTAEVSVISWPFQQHFSIFHVALPSVHPIAKIVYILSGGLGI